MSAKNTKRNLSATVCALWLRRLPSAWELTSRMSALSSTTIYPSRSKNIIRKSDEPDATGWHLMPCFYTAQATRTKSAIFLTNLQTAKIPRGFCRRCSVMLPPERAAVIFCFRISGSVIFRQDLQRRRAQGQRTAAEHLKNRRIRIQPVFRAATSAIRPAFRLKTSPSLRKSL